MLSSESTDGDNDGMDSGICLEVKILRLRLGWPRNEAHIRDIDQDERDAHVVGWVSASSELGGSNAPCAAGHLQPARGASSQRPRSCSRQLMAILNAVSCWLPTQARRMNYT